MEGMPRNHSHSNFKAAHIIEKIVTYYVCSLLCVLIIMYVHYYVCWLLCMFVIMCVDYCVCSLLCVLIIMYVHYYMCWLLCMCIIMCVYYYVCSLLWVLIVMYVYMLSNSVSYPLLKWLATALITPILTSNSLISLRKSSPNNNSHLNDSVSYPPSTVFVTDRYTVHLRYGLCQHDINSVSK